MKRGWSFFSVAVVGVTMLSAGPASASWFHRVKAPKSFQGEFSLQEGSNPAEHGIMYFSHGKIREEITAADGGPKTVLIIDPLNKTIYQIEAEKKAFKVAPWDPHSALVSEALKWSSKRQLLEPKTIDGQECDTYEIKPKEKDVKSFFLYVNKTTRFPVELTTEDSDPAKQVQIEWTKVTTGYQAAMLFTPPLGYAELK
jgi:hypothetical protein